jgi:predicted ester cyclase
MSRADIEDLLARHKAAFARRDVDALTATHAPQGTFESPAYGVVRGQAAIRDVYRYWYDAFPDFMLAWDYALIDPPRASFFWTFDGTASGSFFGQVQRGSRVSIVGAAEYEVSDAGIVSARHMFDFSGVLIRSGVLKIKPS